jgi:cobyrinic acid a,c-diamide synthase
VVARVVVAAPSSGSGKTVVATGLMAALRRAGHAVAPFKVGPDYIDPGYHTLAAGRPGRNLDPMLVGEDLVGPLFAHGCAGADIAVVEGVMGLFDGRVGSGAGSTAHVAEILDAPVLLVVDTRGHSTSLAALLHGFRSWRPSTRLAGVILNQVGSDRHEAVLRDACDDVGLDVVGVLRRHAAVEVPSRHLGLVPAVEHGAAARKAVDAMAGLVDDGVDLAAVVALARAGRTAEPWTPDVERTPGGPVIAVAGGPAFTFGYAEHTELLRAAGAEVVTVDPLRDSTLPEGTAGLVLPGGFPEQYAPELSANVALRRAISGATAPIHAECAGLLYLTKTLDGQPMCGILDAEATMTARLTLGYRDVVATDDTILYTRGTRLTGHEFHRTTVTPAHGDPPAWRWRGGSDGFVTGRVHASYVHIHPAAAPTAVARFVARCSSAANPTPVVAHNTTCVPSEASRKSHNV